MSTTKQLTPQDTFDILAEAAQVRHPNINRDNRGLCPAHNDVHNPALVFKISDTGNLIAYCHAQHCTIETIADAIGVEVSAFFVGSGGSRFGTYVPTRWEELSVLELFKLAPLGYDFDTQVECVMRTLDLDLDFATEPLSYLTRSDWAALTMIWLDPGYTTGDYGVFSDKLTHLIHALNRDTRIDPQAAVGAIPRGQA